MRSSSRGFKRAYVVNGYSSWTYVHNLAILMKLNLLCKQIRFNLAFFGRNEADFRREKNCVSVETVTHSYEYEIQSSVHQL